MTNHNWQSILKTALAKLRKFAGRTDFDISLQKIFGVAGEDTALIKQAWLTENFGTLPNLEIIAGSQINNARGAFAAATNTLYLSEELIKNADLNAITAVFLEEYGHYLDSILNYQDTAGDEGEYFAAVVMGEDLSLWDIARLQTENDQVVVNLAGQAVAIEQNLPVISLGITPINASENNTSGVFTLGRSGDSSGSLTVNYTIGGTATNGTDYSSLSGAVTFAAGSATATVAVNPINDNLYEGNETVTLTLATGTTYTLGTNSTATLTITDDDLVVTQLTNNSRGDDSPAISGNNVVWYGFDGTDLEIFFYNGTSTTQLTNNSREDSFPAISGNNVVWHGYDGGTDREIFFYNGTSTIQLTNNTTNDFSPAISGNNVVWYGYDGGTDLEIFFYNGTSTTQLTNNSRDDYEPAISGNNVVWYGSDGIDNEIYFYNGISTIQLTNNSISDASPQISGNNVVWTGWDGTDTEIFFYNGISTTQLTNNNYEDSAPQISGNNVVWYSWDGTDNEIYFYNGISTIQLTDNNYDDWSPAISGNNVVWYSSDGTDDEIYQTNLDPKILPTITVTATDANAGETVTGTTPNPGVFTLTRSESNINSLTVNYTITGTATNGTDYLQLTGTATFAAGSPTTTITVTPTDDFIIEGNETVTLTLATGTDYTLGTAQTATVTIADNDAIPQVSINDVTITEGNSGTKNANFILTLSNPNSQTISVNYQTVDDDATTSDNDYVATTGTITFTPGQTTKTLPITVNGDTVGEINEAFTVLLTNAVNATLLKNEGIGIIRNDDLPGVTVTPIYTQATESGVPGIFQLNRTGSITKSLNVNYSLSGTATNGTDYSTLNGVATFASGSSTAIIFVNPTEDTRFEGNETAIFTLLTGTGYTVGTSNSSTITIADNDPQPQISINDVTLTEGDSGTKTFNFAVTLSSPSNQTITVAYQTSNVSAVAGTDYITQTGTITFNPGEISKTVGVIVNGDTSVENNETFKVNLSTPVNATIADGEGIGTINNDDVPTLTVNNLTVVEGLDNNAIMTFTLSTPSNQGISVNYSTTVGTATANSDYTPVSGTLTIAAGVTTATLSIPIVNDNFNEIEETFNLALSNPVGAVVVNANPVITITDTIQSSTTLTLPAGVENLQLIGTAAINGTGNTGDNILTGNTANNILAGGNGNDTYSFNATTVLGSDTIQETSTGGVDVIDLTGTTGAATLNLGLTTIQTVVGTNLRLTLAANNVMENIIGGNGADRLTGNSLDNSLVGGLGDDNLRGNGGNDSLTGGVGNDILTGDAGTDRFIYSSGRVYSPSDIGLDLIFDFTTGTDKFVLSKTTFNTLQSVVGNGLSQGSDLAVVDDDDLVNAQAAFIVYSSGSGNLFYNQNGIAAGLGIGGAFANLFNQPTTLTAADFIVIA